MSILLSMALFSFSMSISPGHVNFIALTSGLNHGVDKSFKFVFGATVSFIALLLVIGLGIGTLTNYFPVVFATLKYIGCGYIMFIGYKVYTDNTKIEQLDNSVSTPTFMQGWLMQWLNPKAWVACIAGCSAFDVYSSDIRLMQFLVIYFFICFFGIGCWAYAGKQIQAVLRSAKHIKIFNRLMGSLLFILAVVLLTE